MNKIVKTFQYGNQSVTIETGAMARQATGSVLIRMGDTVLLVTVVAKKEASSYMGMVPLTVHYQEKTYAAGKIPGGYFKREGKPTEKEVLTSRLIDRPLRPLFPDSFSNEVQIIATVLSMDPNIPSDIPAIIGASAALAISGIPFQGPVSAARVGYIDSRFVLNPSNTVLEKSQLDLVVAGTRDAVLMVESEADQLPEKVMLDAVLFGHEQMQAAIRAIDELAREAGKPAWSWEPTGIKADVRQKVSDMAQASIVQAYQIAEKAARQDRVAAVQKELLEKLVPAEGSSVEGPSEMEVNFAFQELEKKIVRERILSGEPRIDGRDTVTVRPIRVDLGLLPRAHGSSLFTRGETQALAVATLGTERDAQSIDDIEGDRKEPFMLHYNFPPFSVGEVGFMAGPKRREVGHGRLAWRALQAVIPDMSEFPYVMRVVSEVLESNGSSSMATVCSSSLALMDAGVPLRASVAGIAMGLIKEGNKFAILTDILGDEDHLGDMDFKVAGTLNGVTALQMDIKITGITKEIMEKALAQAKEARLHILNIMNEQLSSAREKISVHAPRIITFSINPEKIGEVIGKGGATIRELTESTNSTIDISDEGVIKVASINTADAEEAKRRIEELIADVEVGKIYDGKVVKIAEFGAFVQVLPGKQGLVHISQIARERVENVYDYLKEGQAVRVKVIEIDRQGRVRLTMKDLESESMDQPAAYSREG